MCKESLRDDRVGGYPRGRPCKEIIREAAAGLLQCDATTDSVQQAAGLKILALTHLLYQPLADPDDPAGGELPQALTNLVAAVEAAANADALMRGLAYFQLGRGYSLSKDHSAALAAYTRAKQHLDGCDLFSADHWLHEVAPFLAANCKPGFGYRMAFRVLLYIKSRHLDMHDVEAALEAANELVELAAPLKGDYPGDHGWALSQRSRVEREQFDVRAFKATEGELAELAARNEFNQYTYYALGCAAINAQRLGDHARSNALLKQRISVRAKRLLGHEIAAEDVTPATLGWLIGEYDRVGSNNQLINHGNDAYEIALNLYNSGALETGATLRAEALAYLDATEKAWRTFTTNGVQSVTILRAMIELLAEAPDVRAITDRLLDANAAARRYTTRRRSLEHAVRHGSPGHEGVLNRLSNCIDALSPHEGVSPEYAYLHGLLAEYWLRVCQTEKAAGRTPPWATAEAAALKAVPLLRPANVSLNPRLEARVWWAAAESLSIDPDRDDERLQRYLRAVECVAEHMIVIAGAEDRISASKDFSALFADAAGLATALGDHRSADIIMESARRDRIGLILTELVARASDDDVVSAGQEVLAASRATPASVLDSGEESDEDGGEDIDPTTLRERSAQILVDRQAAATKAEAILGPLSLLADPQILKTLTAGTVLEAARAVVPGPQKTSATALLQLFASPDSPGGKNSSVTVFRRLTISSTDSNGQVAEFTDLGRCSSRLISAGAGDPETFQWASSYTDALLPEPLQKLAAAAGDDAPIRLLIVPTGFFHVPFDALPISANHMLIDKAVISLHGSLASTLSLIRSERIPPATEPSFAVYDGARLPHAAIDYAAMRKQLARITPVLSAAELHSALTSKKAYTTAVLAMGVHGQGDEKGWGQAKLMPDGSVVTAADALCWKAVPKLCVLASCFSAIESPDGIELGGFPLALMTRGATTVIGGMYNIEDESTGEVMAYFWEQLAENPVPVTALRGAKLAWRDEHRHSPRSWAGLITYGSACM
ncbi:CHAT domain-containing protein [Mycobacterium asiaticum DSM 44297]|nr:CHAT domain-containing protein [Mycobacterium asiaticum DSM 44297]